MKKLITLLTLSLFTFSGAFAQAFCGVSWYAWENEPDYEGVTGYADNPYENPIVVVKKAPAAWSYDGITDAATFEATWSILGDSMAVANLTSNGVAGDLFDLGEASPSFGAAWKGVHDGTNFYVLLKYWDLNSQADADSRSFEIMAQPTSHDRHDTTFVAASDSLEAVRVAYQNMAYARIVELGGGKALFKDGSVGEYSASVGLKKTKLAWKDYTTADWGSNDNGLLALATATHFWNVDAEGTIRAIMVMSLDGALAYPVDPTDLEGDYTPFAIGDTMAFDVKSNSTVGGTEADNKVEYFWAADKNNGYGSNYYSGHLTLSEEEISTDVRSIVIGDAKVYVTNDFLMIKGVKASAVKIYSITGALVKSVQNISEQLDISDLATGIYVVRLKDVPTAFKVLKQ
jgi:hypothetical protein